MQKAPKLLIVEDHLMLRQGLTSLLKQYDFQIIYEAENGKLAIDLLNYIEPDVILMDIQMPVMNGIEALKIIKRTYPSIKIIMLTGLYDDLYISETTARGADVYLPKNCHIEELVSAIKTIHKNEPFVYATIREPLPSPMQGISPAVMIAQEALTNKEIEILLGICKGESRKMMAERFKITTRTVRYHTYNVYRKTQFSDQIGLINYAVANGYI
jgi:NarL family two-component system response regulator YdfI